MEPRQRDRHTRRAAAAERRRARLVRILVTAGLLPDQRWQDAFGSVPRHAFVRRFFRPGPNGRYVAVAEGDHDWLDLVYADEVLATQLDGDPDRWALARTEGPVSGVPTSSSSQPAIMAIMLAALHVTAGQRVLEIGTGTGYNAALLCHRLGDHLVTTVDIDPHLVGLARERLAEQGYHPTCVAGDGALGHPPNAPYQRVLATCAVATIPPAWLAQTEPGGLVLTTLHRPLGAGLVRLTAEDGPYGQGRVLAENGRFMPLRAHRRPTGTRPEHAIGQGSPTELGSGPLIGARSPFEFFAGLYLPDVTPSVAEDGAVWLVHPDGSWVRHVTRRGRHQVWQGGPRSLWDVTLAAYADWSRLGRPARDRFGLTVGPDGQFLWLDNPNGEHRWPLA